MKIAVIPARGGSKRIPRKNIRDFCGKPMIAWSIEAAQKSGCFDLIVVSTDDDEIAAVSNERGAEVPFIRPEKLSDDNASTPDVMSHAATWLVNNYPKTDLICCIFATAPLLDPLSISQGLKKLENGDCNYVISLSLYSSPIQRAMRVGLDGRVEMFHPDNFHKRSQDLESAYFDAGQFYWGKASSWIKKELLYSAKTKAVVVDELRTQDIDTVKDWKMAELKATLFVD